jgi:hypothetical protein
VTQSKAIKRLQLVHRFVHTYVRDDTVYIDATAPRQCPASVQEDATEPRNLSVTVYAFRAPRKDSGKCQTVKRKAMTSSTAARGGPKLRA